MKSLLQWDIFCEVIDNFGDIGVCWRLCSQLSHAGHNIRLWIDDTSALTWMVSSPLINVTIHHWNDMDSMLLARAPQILVEAFGCDVPEKFIEKNLISKAQALQKIVWINLEYLSAQSYVERCHKLPSPMMYGAAKGITRWFFYPGFTPKTGGLLRETGLQHRQSVFNPANWRKCHATNQAMCIISLFCYESQAMTAWLESLDHRFHIMVTPGRTRQAFQASLESIKAQATHHPHITYLDYVHQDAFDEMLWSCDLNIVRGEDSLVRALWAGQAFVWHIYPQDDDAHHEKLLAFLTWLDAPPSLWQFHKVWNGMESTKYLPRITDDLIHEWRSCAQAARLRLWQQEDLAQQLVRFAIEKS